LPRQSGDAAAKVLLTPGISLRFGSIILVSVGVCLAATGHASAQETGRFAVGAAAVYSTQSSEAFANESPGVLKPAVGGSAPGFIVGTDVSLARGFGVGVEISDTTRFETVQTSGGVTPFQSIDRHHDLIVSGVFYVDRPVISRMTVKVLGGVSYVREDTLVRTAQGTFLGPFGPYGPEYSVARDTIGGIAGVDLDVRVSRHVGVGPTFRAHFIDRARLGEYREANSGLGLAYVVVRFGGGIRVMF
jgi:hypothetical protein